MITGKTCFSELKKICPGECKSPKEVYEFLEGTNLTKDQLSMLRKLKYTYFFDDEENNRDVWWSNWKDI